MNSYRLRLAALSCLFAWHTTPLIGASQPSCHLADNTVEMAIAAQVKALHGTEDCDDRVYLTSEDVTGDGTPDFVMLFIVTDPQGNEHDFLGVIPSGKASQHAVLLTEVPTGDDDAVPHLDAEGGQILLTTFHYKEGDLERCPSEFTLLRYRVGATSILPVP